MDDREIDLLLSEIFGTFFDAESEVLKDVPDADLLRENFDDVRRSLVYIVSVLNNAAHKKDIETGKLHSLGYLIERRDYILLSLLRKLDERQNLGKGHLLVQWPAFSQMLNEQDKND